MPRRSRSLVRFPLLFFPVLAALGAGGLVIAQRAQPRLGAQPDGGVLVPSNQAVTPIGEVRRTEGVRPKDMALSPDGETLAVLTTGRVAFFRADGTSIGDVPLTAGPLGIAWAPDGRAVYASAGSGRVHRLMEEGGRWRSAGDFPVEAAAAPRPGARQPGNPQAAGLAVSPDGRRLYVALGIRNAVTVLELPEMRIAGTVAVGAAPYSIALSRDGRTLYVANRGGAPAPADAADTALSAGTAVRIDRETDAALRGSLSIVDTAALTARQIEAGRQPAGMALSPDGRTLYVANSDGDTVSVVDTRAGRIRRTLSVRPPEDPGFGQIPTDVAVSGDGDTLYVACGGGNAVAVVDLEREPRLRGYLPAGWFPIALAEREGRLYVASSKGLGARPERPEGGRYRVHASVGTVQFISPEDRRDLPARTRQVAANNRWGREPEARRGARAVPIPERVGEPSLFKHVVYIIKENHTYDLTLGDMPEGNGNPALTLFGEEVTPNQHRLAREFVLLDNTYTSGTNSADGHQWTGSAIANGYIEQNYAAAARSYPYDGGDPLAYSPEGFLWTAARKRGHSVRVYGEFVNRPSIVDTQGGRPTWKLLWDDYRAGGNRFRITADTDNAQLKPLLHPRFIGFPSTVSDQWRADQVLEEFRGFERAAKMPALSIMLLPNNHTAGTRPGMPTPRAAVADNDLALGRIVDALTHSRFWPEMLILVIEDDSQLGVDHVDGHRTLAFCVSPYTRRNVVVSEPYNHTSFLRTMELVLGIPAMTRFDRTATPLTACFTDRRDDRPYTHVPNRIPLDTLNPPMNALRGEARRLAEACETLDWSDVDRAEASVVARAVWHATAGGRPFPTRHYHPVEQVRDDDD